MTSSLQLEVTTLSLIGQTLDVRPSDCVGNVGGVEADSTPAHCRAASGIQTWALESEVAHSVCVICPSAGGGR